jgi:hypothetical protein
LQYGFLAPHGKITQVAQCLSPFAEDAMMPIARRYRIASRLSMRTSSTCSKAAPAWRDSRTVLTPCAQRAAGGPATMTWAAAPADAFPTAMSAGELAIVLGITRDMVGQTVHFWAPSRRRIAGDPRASLPTILPAIKHGRCQPMRFRFALLAEAWGSADKHERRAFLKMLAAFAKGAAPGARD